jgi:site-specific recombinase XerD
MPDEPVNLPLFSLPRGEREGLMAGRLRLAGSTSLSAAIQAWGQALEIQGRSVHTVKAFSSDLRLLAKFVGAGQAVAEVGTHDLKHFLEWMQTRRGVPCSPKTYARRVTSIKAFFRWLSEMGVVPADPADAVPQQSVLSPLPEVLSEIEVDLVLQAALALRQADDPDARPYTLLKLLLDTAIKKGECLGIHVNHIDITAPGGPVLFVRYGDGRKRYKERKLPLSEEWLEAYRAYLAKYQPDERLFPWSARRLEYLLEDLGKDAGLDKHLSFDMCRWTAALLDYRDGMDPDKLRLKMGISKIQWREVGNKLDRLAARAAG